MNALRALWRSLPLHGRVGLGLVLIGQAMIVAHVRPVSDYYFPFVWAGYVLVVDAIVFLRRGTSLLLDKRALFLALFPVSSAFWWVFEVFDQAVHNWVYIGSEHYSALARFLMASLDFSFVLPAVVESALLVSTFVPSTRARPDGALPVWLLTTSFLAGLACLVLPIVLPRYFFGLIWGCLFFLIDPLNYLAGRPSIWRAAWRSEWRTPVSFALGALMCGFFWEFWNYWAMPKWIYVIPYVNFFHIFEMPLLGWIGYLPFGLELFAMANFVLPRLKVGTVTLSLLGDRPGPRSQTSTHAAR